MNSKPWIWTASVLLHLLAGAALWNRQVDKGGSPAASRQPQRIAVRPVLAANTPRPGSSAFTAPKPTFISPSLPRILPPVPLQTTGVAAPEPVSAASAAMATLPTIPPTNSTTVTAAAALPQAPAVQAAPAYQGVALPAEHRACSERSVSSLYPVMLRQRGIEGQVLLRVQVNEHGHASAVQVQQGSGWRLLDEAARLVAQACPFVPARRGDQNLASWVEYPVRFALNPQLQ